MNRIEWNHIGSVRFSSAQLWLNQNNITSAVVYHHSFPTKIAWGIMGHPSLSQSTVGLIPSNCFLEFPIKSPPNSWSDTIYSTGNCGEFWIWGKGFDSECRLPKSHGFLGTENDFEDSESTRMEKKMLNALCSPFVMWWEVGSQAKRDSSSPLGTAPP